VLIAWSDETAQGRGYISPTALLYPLHSSALFITPYTSPSPGCLLIPNHQMGSAHPSSCCHSRKSTWPSLTVCLAPLLSARLPPPPPRTSFVLGKRLKWNTFAGIRQMFQSVFRNDKPILIKADPMKVLFAIKILRSYGTSTASSFQNNYFERSSGLSFIS
jgi:hypothetical protein